MVLEDLSPARSTLIRGPAAAHLLLGKATASRGLLSAAVGRCGSCSAASTRASRPWPWRRVGALRS